MKPSPPLVLRSKLTPALAPVLLERECLNALLAPLRGRRLALVVGGADSGKTTFLAQAVRNLPLDHAWLNLDTHDQDCRVFLRGLICAIQELHADFGAGVLRQLERMPAVPGSDVPPHPGGPLDALLHVLETEVPDHLVLVLDDFHLLHAEQEDSPVLETVEYLLARLPRNVHLVMAGRTLPPLGLSRLRATREVLDIGPADLAFTREESASLCRLLAPREPKPEHLDALHAATEGWAAALVLACGDAALPVPLPGSSVLQFVDENVFAAQPEAIQEFMLSTAVLPWLEPELCDALHGPGSQVILERLHGRGRGLGNKLLQAHEPSRRAACVHRGQAAGVAGVPGLEQVHVQGRAVTHLAHDDTRGAIAHCHLDQALQAHEVRAAQEHGIAAARLEFGGVFDDL